MNTPTTLLPKTTTALIVLLRSDFITQWRNRRSVVLVLLVPVIILLSWKELVNKLGAAFILSSCITVGLTAIGLMGYSNALARDRDRGIFQRLRVAPVPASLFMISRLLVQLAMIILLTIVVFVTAYEQLHILLAPSGYIFGFLSAIIGGALYLALGQMIAGLLKNAETVNATTRLVYFIFIIVGMFGDLGQLGSKIKDIIHWSPYGTVKTMLSSAMQTGAWNSDTTFAFFATASYILLFCFLGIRLFRWNVK